MTNQLYTSDDYLMRVRSTSRSGAVAGSIAKRIRSHGDATLQAIGPMAVNQMLKAVTIAEGYLAEDGLCLWLRPSFVEVEIEGEVRTGVKLTVIADPI